MRSAIAKQKKRREKREKGEEESRGKREKGEEESRGPF